MTFKSFARFVFLSARLCLSVTVMTAARMTVCVYLCDESGRFDAILFLSLKNSLSFE